MPRHAFVIQNFCHFGIASAPVRVEGRRHDSAAYAEVHTNSLARLQAFRLYRAKRILSLTKYGWQSFLWGIGASARGAVQKRRTPSGKRALDRLRQRLIRILQQQRHIPHLRFAVKMSVGRHAT